MSLNAWREIELERERKEALRRDHVRREALALHAACEHEMTMVREPSVQQLAARGLKDVQKELQRASAQLEPSPDEALRTVRAASKRLHQVLAAAQAAAHRWSQEQAAAQARIEEVRTRAEAQQLAARDSGAETFLQVDRTLEEVAALHKQGRHREAAAKCEQADALMGKAAQVSLDETVRREVVKGLLAALQAQGFVVDGPSLRKNGSEPGVVRLTGRLPSGRTATFEVQRDGRMTYDLDGYKDRTCAQQVDQIEEVLQKRFGIRLGPPQVIWKNPDRISKGARNLPTDTEHGRIR